MELKVEIGIDIENEAWVKIELEFKIKRATGIGTRSILKKNISPSARAPENLPQDLRYTTCESSDAVGLTWGLWVNNLLSEAGRVFNGT
ncbi:hypothetical protein EVAR_97182_1 [Eumeta japonica]|uniref:Uncharacterized protein n=1 Tax=Eumeta variegata TaxID=151549 RepID=A0A4C1WI31_EUMVA|nr:hypothetical protein EVAR_97182_1 [Eumeta japonica]